MVRGRTVEIFMIDRESTGRWRCTLSNWDGVAYKIPRNMLNKCSDRNDMNRSGLYFLLGMDPDKNTSAVYVGESDDTLNRLERHNSSKSKSSKDDWWGECIAFIGKDDSMNKAHVRYLEYRAICLAKDSGRYELINSIIPNPPSLSESDLSVIEEFLENVRLIVGVLGHNFMDPITSEREKDTPDDPMYYIKRERSAILARGKIVNEGFVILAGSTVSSSFNEKSTYKKLNDINKKLDKIIKNQEKQHGKK